MVMVVLHLIRLVLSPKQSKPDEILENRPWLLDALLWGNLQHDFWRTWYLALHRQISRAEHQRIKYHFRKQHWRSVVVCEHEKTSKPRLQTGGCSDRLLGLCSLPRLKTSDWQWSSSSYSCKEKDSSLNNSLAYFTFNICWKASVLAMNKI